MIPAQAVEAAAKAEWARYGSAHPHATWETDSEEYKEHLRFGVTQILEAAAPHIEKAALELAATEMDRLEALGNIPYSDMSQEQEAAYKAWAGIGNEQAWLRARATKLRKP